MPVIGYFHFATPDYAPTAATYLGGLREAGFIEGQHFTVEYRWAEGHYERLPAMAADLVNRKVDLIAAFGPPPAQAAKNATSTIPIVFEVGNDAVAAGLVESLPHPGGNATGLEHPVHPNYAEAARTAVRAASEGQDDRLAGQPEESRRPNHPSRARRKRPAPRGWSLTIVNASTDSELEAAFPTLDRRQADGFIVAADPFDDTRRAPIIGPAARHEV